MNDPEQRREQAKPWEDSETIADLRAEVNELGDALADMIFLVRNRGRDKYMEELAVEVCRKWQCKEAV